MSAGSAAVIGDGWAALLACARVCAAGDELFWIAGTGARLLPPLPALEDGPGTAGWIAAADALGIAPQPPRIGSFLREWRSRSFRETRWAAARDAAERVAIRREALWKPERRFAGLFDAVFDPPLHGLEAAMRGVLLEKTLPAARITRHGAMQVKSMTMKPGGWETVLANGVNINTNYIIYADKWSALAGIEGVPRPLAFLKGRDGHGALQVVFTHKAAMGGGIDSGFLSACTREQAEELQRNVMGYFIDGGRRSVWTVLTAPDESEDNHEITKKLRRLKQTLDRTFAGADWLSSGCADFMSTVTDEQVHFEEACVFGAGLYPDEPICLPRNAAFREGITVLTDGYGPADAGTQVARAFEE